MQSVSSRIWTHDAVSISYNDNQLHHGHLLVYLFYKLVGVVEA